MTVALAGKRLHDFPSLSVESMMTERTGKAIRRAAWLVVVNVLVVVLLLVILEGGASWLLAIRELASRGAVAERLHTRYDAELGWVSQPNVRRPAMYGPGADLNTNSRGFRGTAEMTPAVPPGKIRIICSGDSFTLGYGVGDSDTWCHRLSVRDPRLEMVNMGQGGYGADQAYLWYRRDAADLEHQIHLFAFITDDFRRMTRNTFIGYPKPMLTLERGELKVQNVPVPRRRPGASWFAKNAEAIRSLRLVSAMEAVGRRARGGAAEETTTSVFEQTSAVVRALFVDLQRRNAERGSKLVLVYLPTSYELHSPGTSRWAEFLEQQATELSIVFIDLFAPFRTLPPDTVASFFLRPEQLEFRAAAGHLTRSGNDRIAALLYDELHKNSLIK
jgi:hypothetical protein